MRGNGMEGERGNSTKVISFFSPVSESVCQGELQLSRSWQSTWLALAVASACLAEGTWIALPQSHYLLECRAIAVAKPPRSWVVTSV